MFYDVHWSVRQKFAVDVSASWMTTQTGLLANEGGQMAENNRNAASGIPRGWIELAVVAGCLIVLLAVFLPAIQEARNAARTTQSRNNLKQLGLALHNYHDVHDSFPLGATEDSNGKPLHGWLTLCNPYVESSSLYSVIFQNRPWDHPINEELFRPSMSFVVMSGADESPTADGFSVTHYLGNPNIFHRVSSVSLSELHDGSANQWLVGEVSGNYQPWGYQFNWRPITLPLNSGDGSFGRPTGDGVQLCLADGSVTFLANEVDRQILASLANAEPIADIALTEIPDRVLSFSRGPAGAFRTKEVLLAGLQASHGERPKAYVTIDQQDNADSIRFGLRTKGGSFQLTSEHVAALQQDYPSAKRLFARGWSVADSDMGIIAGFAHLETLIVNKVELSNDVIGQLKSLGQLKHFAGYATDRQQAAIHEVLPDVEFINLR